MLCTPELLGDREAFVRVESERTDGPPSFVEKHRELTLRSRSDGARSTE